jgi:hypothetical protein
MVGEFVRAAILEIKGGAGGVAGKPCRGGGAFVAEFNIAKIDCWAAFEVFAAARGATGRPRTRGADRERERDQVRVGTDTCRLVLTSSLVASLSAAMVQKSLEYEP